MSKLAIVTGGSSGIGLAIMQALKLRGYSSVSWDLLPTPDPNMLPYFECDVTDENAVHYAYQKSREKFGPIAILVNNCGLQFMSPFESFPTEKWKLLIDVLLTGTFFCSREVFVDMKRNNYGRIINISSIHGKLASAYKAAYVAAKHGVLGLSKVMAIEGAAHGITVNSICPGYVDTPLMRNQVKSQMELHNLSEDAVLKDIFLKSQEVKKLTTSEQIAELVLFLVSDNAATITGEAFNVSGGWGMGL